MHYAAATVVLYSNWDRRERPTYSLGLTITVHLASISKDEDKAKDWMREAEASRSPSSSRMTVVALDGDLRVQIEGL
jgi:hypothetical protein